MTIFRASSMTELPHRAFSASRRQALAFVNGESTLFVAFEHFDEMSFVNVAESKSRVDKMIAGINITIMFDSDLIGARFQENTGIGLSS